MAFRPETAKPLNELAAILLCGPSTLTLTSANSSRLSSPRATIVASVKTPTEPRPLIVRGGNEQLVLDVKQNFESAKISPKLKALRGIAAKVQSGGKSVQPEAIERARAEGAADLGGTFRKPVSHPLP
jgi:hypothetical protein